MVGLQSEPEQSPEHTATHSDSRWESQAIRTLLRSPVPRTSPEASRLDLFTWNWWKPNALKNRLFVLNFHHLRKYALIFKNHFQTRQSRHCQDEGKHCSPALDLVPHHLMNNSTGTLWNSRHNSHFGNGSARISFVKSPLFENSKVWYSRAEQTEENSLPESISHGLLKRRSLERLLICLSSGSMWALRVCSSGIFCRKFGLQRSLNQPIPNNSTEHTVFNTQTQLESIGIHQTDQILNQFLFSSLLVKSKH